MTAIAVMGRLYLDGKIGRALIVAPSYVCAVWPAEYQRFADFPHRVAMLLGDRDKRLAALKKLQTPTLPCSPEPLLVAVINYESVRLLEDELTAYRPDFIVADESQRIKNPNDPATWSSFDVALTALKSGAYSGLGIGIAEDIAAIDIDHCIDRYGNLSDMARDIVERMDSYTETSPSGEGVRTLFAAPGFQYDKARYYINNQKIGLEVYIAGCTSKYVTITGKVLHNKSISERTSEISGVLEAYMRRAQLPKVEKTRSTEARKIEPQARLATHMPSGTSTLTDTEIVQKALSAANADAFKKLWFGDASGFESQSEADLALCNHLAFWTRGDASQIDRLYRASCLFRDKWEREDYRTATIQKAISDCANFYEPKTVDSKAAGNDARGEKAQLLRQLRGLHPEANGHYRWTDIGSGQLFADVYKDTARLPACTPAG